MPKEFPVVLCFYTGNFLPVEMPLSLHIHAKLAKEQRLKIYSKQKKSNLMSKGYYLPTAVFVYIKNDKGF